MQRSLSNLPKKWLLHYHQTLRRWRRVRVIKRLVVNLAILSLVGLFSPLKFDAKVTSPKAFGTSDDIIGSDLINSILRSNVTYPGSDQGFVARFWPSRDDLILIIIVVVTISYYGILLAIFLMLMARDVAVQDKIIRSRKRTRAHELYRLRENDKIFTSGLRRFLTVLAANRPLLRLFIPAFLSRLLIPLIMSREHDPFLF